jgi:protein transport protein SEC24
MDIGSRPELRFGTVDFAVPPAYWAENPTSFLERGLSHTGDLLASLNDAVVATTGHIPTEKEKTQRQREKQREDQQLRRPQSIGRVFAVDVSWSAGKTGIISEVCKSIKTMLYGDTPVSQGQTSQPPPTGRVAIMTYDRSLHFYDLSVSSPCGLSVEIISSIPDPKLIDSHGSARTRKTTYDDGTRYR